MTTYSISYPESSYLFDEWYHTYRPNGYDNDIKWETTTTWNVGVDWGFINNRINGSVDYYKRFTKDLLNTINVPAGVNYAPVLTTNIGSMDNMGVEVTIGAKPVVTDNFTWSTSFNVAWNKNKITELQGDGETSRTQAIGLPSGKGGAGLAWHIVGQPAYTFMVYEQVYAENGDPIEDQYVDQNADGVINEDDLIMYHSRDPKVTMAWNNTFTWKNWDLGISLRANLGNYVYNQLKQANTRVYDTTGAQYMLSNLMADTFLFYNSSSAERLPLSSYFVENASFLRCDNITLGYTIPDCHCGADFGLRIFAAVQNPFVITKFTGLDPEEFSGVQGSPYPRPITTTLGIVLTF